MKSILILLGLLSAAPYATVMAQLIRPVRPIPSPPNSPLIYNTHYPTAASVYSTNYPTVTGNSYTMSNFSLSRTLSYATSRPFMSTTKKTTSTRTRTVTIVPLPSPISPHPVPIIPHPGPFPCEPETLSCDTPTTYSLCAPGLDGAKPQPIFMGHVGAGLLCRYGHIVRAPGGNCSPVGRLTCGDGGERNFYLCAEGGEVDMGPVARGTECIAGNIIAIGEDRYD